MINYPRARALDGKIVPKFEKKYIAFLHGKVRVLHNTIDGKHKRQYSHHDEPRVPLAAKHPLQRSLATTPTPFSGCHSQDRQTVNRAYI